ncbi:uncharacterized protein LOC123534494 [Mercenaria mercenaria]|uniref:uncharacterized protein LOC123534494 n=1 Tax=Mercenaria mercenaria TaxID=6596 RepID=UPI00234E8AA3|nr:uncharacterized protein LOC123534494 [Mercenaria mercenaria]
MTYCMTINSVSGICLVIIISHALVVSQESDETETIGSRVNMDLYHRTSVHNMQDNLAYFPKSAFQGKSTPFHSKHLKHSFHSGHLLFQHLKKERISRNGDNLNHINKLSSIGKEIKDTHNIANEDNVVQKCLQLKNFISKDNPERKWCYVFLHQYYSLRRKGINIFKNKHSDLYENIRFNQRKLLSSSLKNKQNFKHVPKFGVRRKRRNRNGIALKRKKMEDRIKGGTRVTPINGSANGSNSSEVNIEKLALQELEEYEKFVALMKQTFSKDPLRAMLSVSFLLIVMMLAIKLCGMKPTMQHQEKFIDIHEDIHYVNIHDILKRKRRYLPKYLLTWERRLRRKFKRRQRMRKERERELAVDPVSDNSEEESLIYSGNFDF